MQTVDIDDARVNFSRLIEDTIGGETFIIEMNGQAVAKVTPMEGRSVSPLRVGFLAGRVKLPDDFDRMAEQEILEMFGLSEEHP